MSKEINDYRNQLKRQIFGVIQKFNDDVKPYHFTNDDMINVLSTIIKEWTDSFNPDDNKQISAIGAVENVKNSKIKTDVQKKSEIQTIYDRITNSSKAGFGFHSVYIKDINISDGIKLILESDGFVVNTNYTRGFEIKWEDKNNNLK